MSRSHYLNHYDQTLGMFRDAQNSTIAFGRHALDDIADGKTIRQMSIDLCGNAGLEDRISRYVMAGAWDKAIEQGNGTLYEAVREWLTPSHFTVLYQISQKYDAEYAHDLMEQCLIRNSTDDITEVRPVEWLRGKLAGAESPSVATLRHRFWKTASNLLLDIQSEIASLGNLATSANRRELNIIKAVVRWFDATGKVEA